MNQENRKAGKNQEKTLKRASNRRAVSSHRKARQDIERGDFRKTASDRIIPGVWAAFPPEIFRRGAPSRRHWRARSDAETAHPLGSRNQSGGVACRYYRA